MTIHNVYAVGVGTETPLFATVSAAQDAEAYERRVNGDKGLRPVHQLTLRVYDSWQEYASDKDATIRARALERLTAEERRALGFP